jgi:polysaccharide biosynthesis/export protein
MSCSFTIGRLASTFLNNLGCSEKAFTCTKFQGFILPITLIFISFYMTGCAERQMPENLKPALYGPEKTSRNYPFHDQQVSDSRILPELTYTQNQCPPAGTADYIEITKSHVSRKVFPEQLTMRYSPGDRFNVFVANSPDYNGDYVVNADGRVYLPFAGEILAVGLTNAELIKRVEGALIKALLFKGDTLRVSVRPVQYAPIQVTVAGAVFNPGRHVINNNGSGEKGDKALTRIGDSPIDRFVAAAIGASGGVRPDADLTRIKLIRAGKTYVLNWQGAITGTAVDDLPLLAEDHIEVPESNCFQSLLMRPSQITPPGLRIFASNLSQPALNNAGSAVNANSTSIPYGTRFLQGLVSANCVGGSLASNASRFGVLISRNPKTRQTEVIQRPVEELVRSAHRDTINPYLMPDDAIACYDSAITDAREVATTINTFLTPFATWKGTGASVSK